MLFSLLTPVVLSAVLALAPEERAVLQPSRPQDAAASVSQAGKLKPVPSCKRVAGLGYWAMPGELTKTWRFCFPQPLCMTASQIETGQIAQYGTIQQWLWSGQGSATFSVAEQDAIISSAVSLGNANGPPGKKLIGVSFFVTFVVSSGGGYFIGANLTYGACSNSGPN